MYRQKKRKQQQQPQLQHLQQQLQVARVVRKEVLMLPPLFVKAAIAVVKLWPQEDEVRKRFILE